VTSIKSTMPRPRHYVPCISRQVVCALYHEAKRRRLPMTRLADQLLTGALHGTVGWQIAHSAPPPQEPTTPGHCTYLQ
jgi:hypothetical protein